MLLTRPRRKLIFGVVLGLLLAVVCFAVLWRRSDLTYATYLSGFPVSSTGERSYYTFGATRWLILERREIATSGPTGGPAVFEHHWDVSPPGLLEAVVTVVLAALVCHWSWRVLVARLSKPGYCDWCGYDLTGLTAARCPECGAEFAEQAELHAESA